jgi:hypothetical protein
MKASALALGFYEPQAYKQEPPAPTNLAASQELERRSFWREFDRKYGGR